MSFPTSLPRKLLCFIFLCIAGHVLRAGDLAKIEPVITSNGTLVLQVAKVGGDSRLAGIQEYAIMVSEDLVEWREMTRSTLLEELQVEDLVGETRPVRFYRIVGVELEETIRAFSEGARDRLSKVFEYTSGIVLDGMTLAEYEDVRGQVAALREEIVSILANGAAVPESLLLNYRESSGEIDQLLASQPFILEWKGNRYEIETSRAMKALNQQYARLDAVTLQDYDRLLGVDPEDLQGLESFQEFVDRRQVGLSSSLPVFDAISPSGQFDLTTRMVRKHLDILSEEVEDTDKDGIWEIDYELYARLLNGMERLKREGISLADGIEAELLVDLSGLFIDSVLTEQLVQVLKAIDLQQSAIKAAVLENLSSKNVDPGFKMQASSEALDLIAQRREAAFESLEDVVMVPGRDFELFPVLSLDLAESGATVSELEEARLALVSYRADAREKAFSFVDELSFSPEIRALTLELFAELLNGFYRIGYRSNGIYGEPRGFWTLAYQGEGIVFEGPNNEAIYAAASLRNFLNYLPRNIDELLAFSGIENAVDRATLEGFFEYWDSRDLRSVDLGEDSEAEREEGLISDYGLRVQLVQALLDHYGNTLVRDGKLDLALFSGIFDFGESADTEVATIRNYIDLALNELEALGLEAGQAIDWETYYEQKKIADRSIDELRAIYFDLNLKTEYRERVFVSELLTEEWGKLYRRLEEIWGGPPEAHPNGSVLIKIGEKTHVIDVGWLAAYFHRAISRVAVSLDNDHYSRFQIARLTGLSEDDLLGVSSEWAYSEYLFFSSDSEEMNREQLLQYRPNRAELFLGVLPKLLESIGTDLLTKEGVVGGPEIEAALTRGLELSVPVGSSIESVVRQIAAEKLQPFVETFYRANFSKWETVEAVDSEFVALKKAIALEAVPFVKGLVQEERDHLSRPEIFGWGLQLLERSLWEIFRSDHRPDVVSVDLGEQTLTFDFSETESWLSPWYWSEDRMRDDFPGLVGIDFTRSKQIRTRLHYTTDGLLADDVLYEPWIDIRKLLVAVLRRIVEGGDGVPDVYRESVAVGGHVNVEAMRRFFLDIDGTFEVVLADARSIVLESRIRLDPCRLRSMTIENLEAYYDDVLKVRQELMGLLEHLGSSISASDSVEIEEAVTREYQGVLNPFLEYMRSNRLSIELDGVLQEVPFEEIKAGLVDVLESRYPGETLAAYHYASFFGVSVGELREFDKLESFLNSQIVALPRNSEYVEVVSTFSEIGYYQLVDLIFKRFGQEARDENTGAFDWGRLLETASLEETGIVRAEASVNELFDAAVEEVESIEEPNTLDGLEAVVESLRIQRESIRSTLMDDITALSVEGIERVQGLVDERNLEYTSVVEEIVIGRSLQIEAIDASRFVIDMGAHEGDLIAALKEKLAFYEKRALEMDGTVSLGNSYDWETSKVEIYLLIARLAYAYGAYVTDEGVFSVTRFAEQLEVEDLDRMKVFAENAFAEEKGKLELTFPVDPGLLKLEEVEAMGEQLILSREPFYRLFQRSRFSRSRFGYSYGPVLERWGDLERHYASQLRGGDLILEKGRSEARLPLQRMSELSRNVYFPGTTGFLDTYAPGGEMFWDYQRFIDLRYRPVSDELIQTRAFGALSSSIVALLNSFYGNAPARPYLEVLPSGFDRFRLLPGVESLDLEGLDLGNLLELKIPQRAAKDLMKGDLNLRTLSPGSPLFRAGVTLNTEFLDIGTPGLNQDPEFIPAVEVGDFGYPEHFDYRFDYLSWRDQRFRVFVEVGLDYWDILFDENGLFLEDVFEELIRSEVVVDQGENN